jgi:hypothetical protein
MNIEDSKNRISNRGAYLNQCPQRAKKVIISNPPIQ